MSVTRQHSGSEVKVIEDDCELPLQFGSPFFVIPGHLSIVDD